MSYINANTFSTRTTGIAVPNLGTAGNDLLRINEVDPNFSFLNDGSSLLYRMLTILRPDTPTTQPQYWFFEDDQYAIKTTVDTGGNAAATELILDDNIAIIGSVLFFPATNDYALVTANASGTLTIERSYMGATAAEITAGDDVVLLGTTLDEGGTVKGGIARLPTKVDNYVSMFSQSVTSTDVQEVTNMLNGVGQVNGEFAKQTLHVMRQMDQALRWSKGLLDADLGGSGKPAYYTKGLSQYITTNAELPASLTWYDMNDAFNAAFLPTNSSSEKTLVCSQAMYSKINKVAFDRWVSNPMFEETLGAMIRRLQLDSGNTIDVVLDKYGFASTAGTQGFLLDLPYVGTKALQNFELNWRDVTLPNAHSVQHEVFGSTSVWVKLAGLHRTVTLG